MRVVRWGLVFAVCAACHSSGSDSTGDPTEDAYRTSLLPDKGWSYVGFVPYPTYLTIDATKNPRAGSVSVHQRVVQVAGEIVPEAVGPQPYAGRFTNGFVSSGIDIDLFTQPNAPGLSGGPIEKIYGFRGDRPWGLAWWSTGSGTYARVLLPGSDQVVDAPDQDEWQFEDAYGATLDENGGFAQTYLITRTQRFGVVRAGMRTEIASDPATPNRAPVAMAFDGATAWILTTALRTADNTPLLQLWSQSGAGAPLVKAHEEPVDAALVTHVYAHLWSAGGGRLVAQLGQSILYYDGASLARQPIPPSDQYTVAVAGDGSIVYGWSDGKGGCVSRVTGGALVPVGAYDFTKQPALPQVSTDGNDVYVAFYNGDPGGVAIACNGPSCVPYVKPTPMPPPPPPPPPPADASGPPPTVLSCMLSATSCKEVTHFADDYPPTYEQFCVSQAGKYAPIACPTANEIGGCRTVESNGMVVTQWFYSGTASGIMSVCAAAKQTFVAPGG